MKQKNFFILQLVIILISSNLFLSMSVFATSPTYEENTTNLVQSEPKLDKQSTSQAESLDDKQSASQEKSQLNDPSTSQEKSQLNNPSTSQEKSQLNNPSTSQEKSQLNDPSTSQEKSQLNDPSTSQEKSQLNNPSASQEKSQLTLAQNENSSSLKKKLSVSSIDNTVSYSANSTNFVEGGLYIGTIVVENPSNNTIEKDSKIVISIASNVIDYTTLKFLNTEMSEYFHYIFDSTTGTIIFTTKKDLIGDGSLFEFKFSGSLIGKENNSYPVEVSASTANGASTNSTNNNPTIQIDETPIPIFGLVNMYWGITPSNKGDFLGPNSINIENVVTGIFDKTNKRFENFLEANPNNEYSIPKHLHYEMTWTVTDATVDPNNIVIYKYQGASATVIPPSSYTLTTEQNQVKVVFPSENNGGLVVGTDAIRISLEATVEDTSDVYFSVGSLYIKNESTETDESFGFELNNAFDDPNNLLLYPIIEVEDKEYWVGDLNDDNMEEELLNNIIAKDTHDGDISSSIEIINSTVDPNTPGKYEVTYSITNSQGNTVTKTAIITILAKEQPSTVIVKYQDTEGNFLSKDIILKGNVGTNYSSVAKIFTGYTLIKKPSNANGEFMENTQTIIYIYQKNVDPTDPTDPTDPNDPNDPTNPTNPNDPTDPTNPTDPIDPSNPNNSTGNNIPTETPNNLITNLPQTGFNTSLFVNFLGVILLGISALLIYRRKAQL